MNTDNNYVAGFMFSQDRTEVAMIRKEKPAWQKGKLNGIGGKLEPGEPIRTAMVREFEEETGCKTRPDQWHHYCMMAGTNDDGGQFQVDFFVTEGDLWALRSVEAEKVEAIRVRDIYPGHRAMIDNVPWLISLALDFLQDSRPSFVTASYRTKQQNKQRS